MKQFELNDSPNGFKSEITTLWSFPERGKWATHSSDYRGNFAPQIARNIIEMYSDKGDTILDPMVGSGTTLIEARLLERNAVGIDINPKAVQLSQNALCFDGDGSAKQEALLGDARNLSNFQNDSIDLIISHPPYLNIIQYSEGKIEEDLSNISSIPKFCDEIEKVAQEMFRVLRPNKYCAILIGDTRKGKHYVPLSHYILRRFLRSGFALKENIIKAQHNCSYSKRWEFKAKQMKFYLIMHENLYVFRKPAKGESISKIKWSLYSED